MIEGLKPYPALKDSDIPWLGQVPRHWDIAPAIAAYRPKLVKNTGMLEKTVLSLSYGRIVVKPPEKLHGLVPESFETYQIIEPDDIIVRTTDLQNDRTSLRIGQSKNRGIITSAYMCLQTTNRVSAEFGYQFLNAYDLLKIIYGFGSGLRQNLEFHHIKGMPVLIPPSEEQLGIVKLLGYADSQIRRYISAKQKLIKLLEEEKEAIIHHAVTRGLNPNVRLKQSGAEWLGNVPDHWEVKRGKYYFREVDERSVDGSEELMSVSHKTGVTPRSEKNITMFMAESYAGHKLCRPGDVAVNTMWAWMAAVGVAKKVGIVSSSYGVYRAHKSSDFQSTFLDLLLRTHAYRTEYMKSSRGITTSRLRLYPDDFLRILFVRPPLDEQESIVFSIQRETAGLQKAIVVANREIELLREYRTRLIADVVTGKLDVREAAAKLPDIESAAEPLDEIDELPQDDDTAEVQELEAEDAA